MSPVRIICSVLTALSTLRLLPDHYRLSLAGDGQQETVLRRRVDDLQLGGRVRFLGRLSDVSAQIRRSDVLLHPSLWETFGFSLIEAADHGLPVVALPVSSVDELVPGLVPGTMAHAPTPRALAEAVHEAVRRGGPSAEQHVEAWRRRREKFSATTVVATWLTALTDGMKAR